MANITYTVNRDTPQSIPNVEVFSQEDTTLANTFQVNQLFDSNKHSVELHIYNLAGELQESEYNYVNYKELGNAASAGKEGASILTIDPIEDVKLYGYDNGGVKMFYNFINDLYTENRSTVEFFIDSISPDRTELKLKTFNLAPEQVLAFTSAIKTKLETQSYFNEFRINLLNNDLFIGVNIDTLQEVDDTSVVVKLYEPLPGDVVVKSTVSVVELVSDSAVYEVTSIFETEEVPALELRSPNFNLDLIDESVVPTGYYDYDTLLSLPISNTTNELYSLVNSKGVQLSIDHNDYSNFVHFSSAQERLLNFKYKLDLIQSYNTQIASFQAVTTPSLGTTGSIAYYEGLVKGIVNNFDHYERFLYYESGSNSWPKTNNTKPYINDVTSVGDTWFSSKLTVAATYDATNTNILINSIPSYLRDDTSNASYITFIHMIGQHFDNMWVYAKGVSDKYNADNRLDFGISRDLVAEVLKNFGVKLYTSNKSVEDLFSSLIGQSYQSGSEVINTYVTGSVTGSNASIQPSSFDNYQREIYKRMYHNLPLLLKSKGTERGLRALINCFGIPSDILDIKVYGGRNVNERPFYGDYRYYTSSLGKVRLDNTGSIVPGNTLSQYTSVLKREYKYTDDLHPIEIGFSPTDNVDNYIISKSLSTGSLSNFNIDEYLGDPRNLYLDNYYNIGPSDNISGSLSLLTGQIMSGSDAYNVQDFVRLIKFFDNTIFKVVKDFIPARSTVDTGVIIKPHLLQRNKAKSVILSGSRPEHSGSIDTAFIDGNSGGSYNSRINYYNTSYTDTIQTPNGLSGPFTEPGVSIDIVPVTSHAHEEARFNGELDNSEIQISNGELNSDNIYKAIENVAYPYNINFVSASDEICLLNVKPGATLPIYITSSTATLSSVDFFVYTNASSQYTASIPKASGTPTPITFPTSIQQLQTTFGGLTQYSTGSIKVNNANYTLGDCTSSVDFIYATCSLGLTSEGQNINDVIISPYPNPGDQTVYNLTNWFTYHPAQTVQYTLTVGATTTVITNPTSFQFNPIYNGSIVTISISDPKAGPGCILGKTVSVGNCVLGAIATGSQGLEFTYSSAPAHLSFVDANTGTGETTYVPGNQLGFPQVVGFGTGGTIRFIEQPIQVGGGIQRRGLQSYFTPYPPDPGTLYWVYFIRRQGSIWTAETILGGVTNGDVADYNQDNGWIIPPPDSGNIPSAPGANPPIKVITPYINRTVYIVDSYGNLGGSQNIVLGPDEVVRAIVIEAALPNGGCTRRVTIYPGNSQYGGIPTEGNAIFQSVDIPINWNTALLGTPIAGVDILYGVPIRTHQ